MKKSVAIQMIGTQRSGSNLLRLLLNQLHISAPHPPHILERFMPLISMYGDLAIEKNFYNLVDDVCRLVETNPVSWGNFIFDRKDIISKCNHNELVEIVRVIYEIKCEIDGAQMWMCKSMANIHYIEELEKYLIPYYLFLYRDGRDVALSFKKAIVGEKHPYFLAKQWKEEQDLSLKLYEKLGHERVIMVKYENLIMEPEHQLVRICDFLHIKYQKEALDFYRSQESIQTAHAGVMWENVKKPIIDNNFNKYQLELTEEEISIFERVAGNTLQKLGYNLDYPEVKNSRDFLESEIITFQKENNQMKIDAKNRQLENDKEKRKEQNELIDTLNARFQVHQIS